MTNQRMNLCARGNPRHVSNECECIDWEAVSTPDQPQQHDAGGVGRSNAYVEGIDPAGYRGTFVMDGSDGTKYRREAGVTEVAFWLEIERLRTQVAEWKANALFQANQRDEAWREIERLQTQVAQLTEERQREREVGTLEHARQHVSCGVVIAAKENEIESLRARCASLEEHQRYVGGVYADLMKSHEALEARCASLEAALKQIQVWDCLNPPDPKMCADHPWLRRLVDAALVDEKS